MSEDMPNTKTCTSCGETKPLSAFYVRSALDPLGPRRARCKDCERSYAAKYHCEGPSIERKIINEMVKHGSTAFDKFSPEVREALGAEKPIDPDALAAHEKRQKTAKARERRRKRERAERDKLHPMRWGSPEVSA